MRDFEHLVRQHVSTLGLPAEREDKIVEEWGAHLGEVYDGLLAEGMTDPEAWSALEHQLPDWERLTGMLADAEPLTARMALPARSPLPGPAKRRLISSLRATLTAGLAGDVRSALRLLAADRTFSAAVILTLAICLGANAAVFTVVHAVLLRPLPVADPDRLVGLGDVYPTITPDDILANDVPSYFDRLAALTTLEEQALFAFWFDTITIDGVAEEVRGMRTTASFFRLLGLAPALGRTFTEAEAEGGADPTIVLSHGLWQRLYAGDPSVIGRPLRLGWTGKRYTIIGVMPQEFSFFDRGYDGHSRTAGDVAQFWIPLVFTPAQRSDAARTRYGFFHIGRLRPGATVEQVQAQADALLARNVERFPQFRFSELGMYTAVTPLHDALTRDVRRTLYLLWAAAGFVLVIGTINIANLSLARASTRGRGLATRLALGASRFQVARQLAIEGLIPAAIGGAAGVALAAGILRTLSLNGIDNLPNARGIEINATVIAAIAIASAAVGVLAGLVPGASVTAAAVTQTLLDGGRGATDGVRFRAFRRALVVLQIALSVVLLTGAALLLISFKHLLDVDPGFTATRVTTATIFPPPSRYPDAQAVTAISNRLLEQLRNIPGVEQAGMTSNIALSGNSSPSTVSTTALGAAAGEPPAVPSVVGITPGYFEAMATPLVRGRYFSEGDHATALPVAIVDERLAARLWPAGDPVGRQIFRGESGPYTVVGVVRDVRFEGLAAQTDAIGTAYFPHTQAPPLGRLRWIAIKASTESAGVMRDVRTVLTELDPDLPLSDIQTMSERTARAVASPRMAAALAGMCGVVALVLSVLGIYGVLAYIVARRTREIGIRLALGSSVRGIFRLVFSEGLALVVSGLVLGSAGAVALGHTLESQLHGVRAMDPLVLSAVLATTALVALLACLGPALRATRVDPVGVLSEQ